MRFGGLIAAIAFAAIAAVIVLRTMSAPTAPSASGEAVKQDVKATNVFVAALEIPVGTTLTAEMLAVQPWPESLLLKGFVKADEGTAAVIGMVARSPFQAQEPVLMSKLANRNDPNFLAGELPKGMRVISVVTNETEGLAGFVFPGDHVDVLLTHEVVTASNVPGAPAEREAVSETLLTNVKVLAVDQRSTGANATDANGKLLVPRSVSLMVSPTDAQRLRLAQKVGTVTLVLRSIDDKEAEEPLSITRASGLSQYKGDAASVAASESESVLIRRGAPRDTREKEELESAITRGASSTVFDRQGGIDPAVSSTPRGR